MNRGLVLIGAASVLLSVTWTLKGGNSCILDHEPCNILSGAEPGGDGNCYTYDEPQDNTLNSKCAPAQNWGLYQSIKCSPVVPNEQADASGDYKYADADYDTCVNGAGDHLPPNQLCGNKMLGPVGGPPCSVVAGYCGGDAVVSCTTPTTQDHGD